MPNPDIPEKQSAGRSTRISRDIEAIDRKLASLEGRLAPRATPETDDDLRHVVDCIADPAVVLADGRLVCANAPAAKAHGAEHRDDLVGIAQIALVHPEDRHAFEARLDDVSKRGGAVVFAALRGLTVTGDVFRETVRMAAVTWQGRPAYLLICRKYASAETRSVALGPDEDDLAPPALEGVNSGVWEWNPGTGAVYLGPRLKEMLDGGARTRRPTFAGWPEIVNRDDLENVQRSLETHVEGGSKVFDVEARLRIGDGDYRWVRLIGKALRDDAGNVARVTGTASDISRLKATEAELKGRMTELAQIKALMEARTERMAELETELRASKHAVELAEHDATGFLATMSHELRTPLNAIMGFAEVIRDEMLGPVGVARYRDYANDILSGATHLLGVVSDILDLSDLETGNSEFNEEPLDLRRVVASVARLGRSRADEADLVLDIDASPDLPMVLADARMVKKMMLQLLSDAIKFTPKDGTIELSAFVGDDGGMCLAVCDTGDGMVDEAAESGQRSFGQVGDPLVRGEQGVGLGLPIVRAQVELHGGRLEFESVPGVGTMATLCFPPKRTILRD